MVGTPHAQKFTRQTSPARSNGEVPFAIGEHVEVIIKSGVYKGNWVQGVLRERAHKPDYFHIYVLPTEKYGNAAGNAGSILENVHIESFRRIGQPAHRFQKGDKAQVEVLTGEHAGTWLLCTILGLGTRPHTYDVHVEQSNDWVKSGGNAGRDLKNVSTDHLRGFRKPETRQSDHSICGCIPWTKGFGENIAIGNEVVVTKLEQKLQQNVLKSGMSWPSGPSHRAWQDKLGKKGIVECIDEDDMTVYLSDDIGWVPINALVTS